MYYVKLSKLIPNLCLMIYVRSKRQVILIAPTMTSSLEPKTKKPGNATSSQTTKFLITFNYCPCSLQLVL